MHIKYIIFLVFMFVVFQLCLIPMGNEALNEEAAEHLNILSSFGIVQSEEGGTGGIFKYVKAIPKYFTSMFTVMTSSRDNPMFAGQFELIRWIVMAPLMAGIAYGLIVVSMGLLRRSV